MTRREAERVLIVQGCYIITKDEKETILGTDGKHDEIVVTEETISFGFEMGNFDFTARLDDVKADEFDTFEITGKLTGGYS